MTVYEAEAGDFTVALTGDTLLTRRLAVFQEEPFLRLRQLLRGADAAFTNLEAPVHRYLEGGHAQRQGGGTYMTTEPHLLDDLDWLGINLVACGSSHADDYGPDGILRTIEYLNQAGIAHAGSGRHLAEARAPTFMDTRRGRVALVAAAAPHREGARAGEQRRDTPGFPGINGLRHQTVYQVDRDTLEALMQTSMALGWHAELQRRRALGDPAGAADDDSYNFLGHHFTVGPEPRIRTYANRSDVEEILQQVAYARANADYVIVSLHCHEQGGPSYKTAERRSGVAQPAEFAVDFAHQVVDAGAHVFAGHGPQHQLGVEIYRDRPIFYGLGSFIFQLETVQYLPAEAYERYGLADRSTPYDFVNARYIGDTVGHPADPLQWEQAVSMCEFGARGLAEVHIYPIELGFGRRRSQRGRPLLASAEASERIVDRIARLSKELGTTVTFDGEKGLIRL